MYVKTCEYAYLSSGELGVVRYHIDRTIRCFKNSFKTEITNSPIEEYYVAHREIGMWFDGKCFFNNMNSDKFIEYYIILCFNDRDKECMKQDYLFIERVL